MRRQAQSVSAILSQRYERHIQRHLVAHENKDGIMKEQTSTSSFNFDEWMQLAQDNPEAFEEKRLDAIQGAISSTEGHSQKRLEGLQWQIDQMRTSTENPMAACLNISKMMWENVQGEDGLVDTLNQLTGKAPVKVKEENLAEVLQFSPRSAKAPEKTG